ncbi:MAG: 3-hydroxyacyl-CoA dehydrogenase family protein [Sediminibacterium sp.]
MQIVVKGTTEQYQEFLSKPISAGCQIYRYGYDSLPEQKAIWFNLNFEEDDQPIPEAGESIVFGNAVLLTQSELPPNYVRINAWNGFLQRPIVELVAGGHEEEVKDILNQLHWPYTFVPDVPGMITARVISMIINEAYFAWGDNVSSKADIDTAMKLGTNYPMGPFEWCEKIGVEKVYKLLSVLSEEDKRYTPAPALENEYEQSIAAK